MLQMGMLCWHLLRSNTRRGPEIPVIHFAETIEPSTSSIDVPYHRNPLSADPSTSSAVTTLSGGSESAGLTQQQQQAAAATGIERPTPAPEDHTPAADLIEHARRLRLNGDVNSALAELRQAQLADPSNPQIIAELGITYEAMQLSDRAYEQWQRLYSMGDAIGALYYLADAKLHSAPAAPQAPGAAAGPGGQAPADAVGAARDAAGFQDNAVLTITDIQSEEEEDPAAEKKVILKIVVKNRPGIAIDPKKVRIDTYFYDLVDGKDVLQTDAQTGYAWLTKPVTWANDQSQVLETTYFRPRVAPTPVPSPTETVSSDAAHGSKRGSGRNKAHAAESAPPATPAPTPVRVYRGYVVRLYYDRQLQAVRADPVRLLQQFPPPLTLSED